MASRSRRKWQLRVLATTLFLFCVRIWAESPDPVKVFYTYDHLLHVAEEKITTYTPTKAFNFLAKAKELRPEPDYRYYNILGEAHSKLGQDNEAMEAFEKSVELNSNQFPLFLRISDYYENNRKPDRALLFTEKYLLLVPTDKNRIYKAAILSRRIGKEESYQKYIKLLESDTSFATEEDALQSSLSKHIKNKKWKEAEELTIRYIPFFPRTEGMYEYLILSRRGKKSPLLEEAYILACVTFKEETRYFVRYGVYLQENGRYLEALSIFRRAFFNALKFETKGDWDEILFLLRQSYANLGWEKETLAIDLLVKDIKRRDSLKDEDLENHIQTHRKNREYLQFAVYWFKDKNEKKTNLYRGLLKERDQENEVKEFLFVIGPFALENLEL